MDLDWKIVSRRERLLRDIDYAKLIQRAGAESRDRDAATASLPVLYQKLSTLDSRAKVVEKKQRATLKVFTLGVLAGMWIVKYGLPALCSFICR